ncbi:hypothetical protein Q7O_001705 [Pectobacterium carotovorum subsp. carotovorum PCCS1]|nr:hypothetical protein [Pectobacterium carotovorum subsp. carotovorum PCCS1]
MLGTGGVELLWQHVGRVVSKTGGEDAFLCWQMILPASGCF